MASAGNRPLKPQQAYRLERLILETMMHPTEIHREENWGRFLSPVALRQIVDFFEWWRTSNQYFSLSERERSLWENRIARARRMIYA